MFLSGQKRFILSAPLKYCPPDKIQQYFVPLVLTEEESKSFLSGSYIIPHGDITINNSIISNIIEDYSGGGIMVMILYDHVYITISPYNVLSHQHQNYVVLMSNE
jgi:hypothetical protein